MTGRAFALPVLLFNAFASAAMPVCTPLRKERHRGAQRPGEARRKSRSNTLIPSRSTAKIFPYFFPLQNFFPLTLFFACFKKPLKTLHFLTVIFRIFPISYNSNPGFSAKKDKLLWKLVFFHIQNLAPSQILLCTKHQLDKFCRKV